MIKWKLPFVLSCMAAAMALLGCEGESLRSKITRYSFFQTGSASILGDAEKVGIDQIHLNPKAHVGKSLIVDGHAVKVDEDFTYVVIDSFGGRILVQTPPAISAAQKLEVDRRYSFLGSLDIETTTFPIIVASAIYVQSNAAESIK